MHYEDICVIMSLEDIKKILRENINKNKIILTNKEGEEIKFYRDDIEEAVELSEEIKKISFQIGKKIISFYHSKESIIKDSDFISFIDMATQYHIKVITRDYLLERSGFTYRNQVKIKKSIYEVLASEYCINHTEEINKYAKENSIFMP